MELDLNNNSCNICLMDDSALGFERLESGGCNFCHSAVITPEVSINQNDFEKLINSLLEQKGEYKAVVGISGGVDSAYVAHVLDQYGIKALLVHMDNGWNSHLATFNIKQIVNQTRHDFVSYVLFWPELREMQKRFFSADVVDVELLYDHAAIAVLHYYAKKFNSTYSN